MTVCDAGQLDAGILAVDALRHQNRVQEAVAGLVLRLVNADVLLQLVEVRKLRAGVEFISKERNLVLQVVVLLVDHVNGLLA